MVRCTIDEKKQLFEREIYNYMNGPPNGKTYSDFRIIKI